MSIDNSNLVNYRANTGTTGFTPAVTYAYDAGAHEIDFVDNSTFPSGVALKKTIVRVHDKFGGEVRGFIYPVSGSDSGHDGETTVSTATLNESKPLDISVTVIANDDKLVADGGAYDIGEAGSISNWDAQKNA